MNLDYQHKYLKYKKKYLDLKYKEYSGGDYNILNNIFTFKVSKDYALKNVRINGRFLEKIPYFQDDREVVLAAIVNNPTALRYTSDKLKKDRTLILEAVQKNGSVLENVSDTFKADKDIVLAAVKKKGTVLGYASPELREDIEVVLAAVKQDRDALYVVSEKLKNNPDFNKQLKKLL